MKLYMVLALCACLFPSNAQAQFARRGGGNHAVVQNRSANVNRNYNRNTNVNRNVNVNQNINVNRNVNVNVHGGCYNCGYYHDDSELGLVHKGAAVGVATTAVVAAATRPSSTTVVVAAPAMGTVVPALPGGCSTVSTGGAVIYQCSNIYYRPYYQGSQLVYQVVTYP
jgi:outer membrane usher protein FimD/PapC